MKWQQLTTACLLLASLCDTIQAQESTAEPERQPLSAAQHSRLESLGLRTTSGRPFAGTTVVFANSFREDLEAMVLLDEDGTVRWMPDRLRDPDASDGILDSRWSSPFWDEDFNADGLADLHASSWSGGANCCITHYLFEPGRLSEPFIIWQGYGDTVPFTASPDGGTPTLWIADSYTHAMEWDIRLNSPWVEVPLRFMDGKFTIDRNQLNRIDLGGSELIADAREGLAEARNQWRKTKEFQTHHLARLVDLVVRHVYAGRGSEVDGLLQELWPADLTGDQDFRCRLRDELEQSWLADYFVAIQGASMADILKAPPQYCPPPARNRWGPGKAQFLDDKADDAIYRDRFN